jgi:hypothetical protein
VVETTPGSPTVRKFLFNGAIISAIFSGISLLKSLSAG